MRLPQKSFRGPTTALGNATRENTPKEHPLGAPPRHISPRLGKAMVPSETNVRANASAPAPKSMPNANRRSARSRAICPDTTRLVPSLSSKKTDGIVRESSTRVLHLWERNKEGCNEPTLEDAVPRNERLRIPRWDTEPLGVRCTRARLRPVRVTAPGSPHPHAEVFGRSARPFSAKASRRFASASFTASKSSSKTSKSGKDVAK